MTTPSDFVASLGALTLDHRFKRLMNTLLSEAETLYADLDLPLKPRWCSTLQLLESRGACGVGEIASELRMTSPAVVQILEDMRASGLIARRRSREDARRTVISLSPRGQAWMPVFHRVWRALERAQEEAFQAEGSILTVIDAAESAIAERSIARRAKRRLRSIQSQIDRTRAALSSPSRLGS